MNFVIIGRCAINLENIADVDYIFNCKFPGKPEVKSHMRIRFASGSSTEELSREFTNEDADSLWKVIQNHSKAPMNTPR
jgi:hypothetical protein